MSTLAPADVLAALKAQWLKVKQLSVLGDIDCNRLTQRRPLSGLMAARMYLSTAIPLNTIVPLDTIVYDAGKHCTTGTGAKYTVSAPGLYCALGSIQTVGASTQFVAGIWTQSTPYWGNYSVNNLFSQVTFLDVLNVGDTIQLALGGAGVTATGGLNTTYLSVAYLGPA